MLKKLTYSFIWALVILILCAIPGHDIPHISYFELFELDKLIHALLFFVLTSLTQRGLLAQAQHSRIKQHAAAVSVIGCAAYGGLLELMQGAFFIERSADVFDFIANTFGCLVAILAYRKTEKCILYKLIPQE